MKIGVTMSGGGYRAAAYSLGTLSYLNALESGRETLLKQVRAISTVSGGSITGLSYAQSVKRGETFAGYFNRLFSFLTEEDLVNDGITNFVTPGFKNSLIEGFARVYTEKLFDDETFESILPKKNTAGEYDTHLDFTCINATEFNTGTPFRFIAQKQGFAHRIGNHYYKLDRNRIGSMPLGIPLAASSCFPGGFEPISIDIGPYLSPTSVLNRYEHSRQVSLMDGGVVDNQGIGSVLLHDMNRKQKDKKAKKQEKEELNLVMVVDVSSPDISGYKPAKEKKIPLIGNLKMIRIYRFVWMTNILLAASLFLPFIQQNWMALMTVSCLLTLFTAMTFMLTLAKAIIKKTADTNQVGIGKINKMNILRPNAITELFLNRVHSVSLLTGSIFLKHLRSKNYDDLFANKEYVHKCFSTAIYDLKHSGVNDKKVNVRSVSFFKLGISEPTATIRNICTVASEMKTTLWVPLNEKGKETIRDVIVAGQVTTCINFIIYYHKIGKSLASIEDRKKAGNEGEHDAYHEQFLRDQINRLAMIDKQARKHWKKFIENPWWMMDELKKVMS